MPRPTKTNTLVTMYVDTTVKNLSQTNIKDHVWMADSNGDIKNNSGSKVDKYITGAQKKGNITWVGAVKRIFDTPSDAVLITNITMNNDPNGIIRISQEPTKKIPTHVNGKIAQNAKVGIEFDYTIHFTLIRDGKTDLQLCVDPKIRIDPTS